MELLVISCMVGVIGPHQLLAGTADTSNYPANDSSQLLQQRSLSEKITLLELQLTAEKYYWGVQPRKKITLLVFDMKVNSGSETGYLYKNKKNGF